MANHLPISPDWMSKMDIDYPDSSLGTQHSSFTQSLHDELRLLLARLSDLDKLRPSYVLDAFKLAEKLQFDIAGHPIMQLAMQHLMDNFIRRQKRYEPSSLLRLTSGWNTFSRWCFEHGHSPLPALPSTVEAYFSHRFNVDERHRNTLRMDTWVIRVSHKAIGAIDPIDDEYVKDHIAGLMKDSVRDEQQIKQAPPFNERLLDKLIEVWGGSSQLLVKRNLAVLAVAYESMLRAQELANIKLKHLTIFEDGHGLLYVPITKTNHSGEGDSVYLSPAVIDIIYDYLELAKTSIDDDGYLFFGVTKHGNRVQPKVDTHGVIHYKKITTRTIDNIFEAAWKDLNLDRRSNRPFTAHSARVGACQDLLRKGYSIPQIQQSGRWSGSQMIYRYGRDILAEESAMAMARKDRQNTN